MTAAAIDALTLIDNLNWRYATKKFDATKIIPAATWGVLEQSLVLTPSSFGLQPWKFVVVQDKAVRAKLRAVSWNQPQITDASHLVVMARRDTMDAAYVESFIQSTAELRKIPAATLAGYKGMMLGFISQMSQSDIVAWNARQVYIALGFFLSTAAQLNVDACPMEGIDAAKYNEILGLNGSGYSTVVAAAAGYRAADDELAGFAKTRFPASQLIERR